MRKAVIRELQFLSILRMTRSSVYYQFIKCFFPPIPHLVFLYIQEHARFQRILNILTLLMKLFYLYS